MLPELYTALSKEKVIKEAAIRSGVSEGVMSACWDAAGEVIKAWATEGHSVALPGLGTMRFTVRSKAVADVNDVKSNLIKSRRIVFTPATEVKEELGKTAIQITCFDRNGVVVKRVTNTSGDVEDGDDDQGTENNGSNPSSGSGGGSQQSTVAAPTFSGATQFTESTQVTMSGPAGASIFYTVDGSTPTDQSLEYEEPITLSATTTVKAIAIKDGISSAVTSRTYSKVEGGGDDEPGGDDH